jgi:hypothetical protein
VTGSELEVEEDRVPEADLYLNMCQGARASARLQRLLPRGAICLNTPTSVQACHRYRLVPQLRAHGLPFPPTVIVPTDGPSAQRPPVHLVTDNGHPVWVKRGDVHAEVADDVVAAPVADVASAVARFAARGVRTVALQQHVPGPVIKFYGVSGGHFFHWYPADREAQPPVVDAAYLRSLADRAAAVLGLDVFGGDAVIRPEGDPILIDVNDWPSFAPVRVPAAEAIAHLAHELAFNGRDLCLTR